MSVSPQHIRAPFLLRKRGLAERKMPKGACTEGGLMNCYTRLFAVVTGPSSGIGHELAKQLEESGYDLLNDGVETLFETIRISDRPLEAIAINAGVDVGGDFTRRTALIRS